MASDHSETHSSSCGFVYLGDDSGTQSVNIHLPVYVKSATRALSLLGGIDSLASGIQSTGKSNKEGMKLWLRPEDPFSHPIRGGKTDAFSFALRCVKKGSTARYLVLSTINAKYSFQNLADFQYVPSGIPLPVSQSMVKSFLKAKLSADSLTEELATASTDSSWMAALQHAEASLPSVFAVVDTPQNYNAKTGVAKDVAQGLPSKSITVAAFNLASAEPVPTAPKETVPAARKDEIVSCLTRAFSTRPVWQLNPLEEYLKQQPEAIPRKFWKLHLPAVAYCVRAGPYQNSWIRLGFDPRVEEDAFLYQVISMRIPDDCWKCVTVADGSLLAGDDGFSDPEDEPAASSASKQFAGTYLRQRGTYQICDLYAEGLGYILHHPYAPTATSPPPTDVSTPGSWLGISNHTTGWYDSASCPELEQIQRARLGRFDERLGWFTAGFTSYLRAGTILLSLLYLKEAFKPSDSYVFERVAASLRAKLLDDTHDAAVSDEAPLEASV